MTGPVPGSETGNRAGGSESSTVLGSTLPRLWTPPLVELTPATSYGYDVIDFADRVLGAALDPWQEWLVVHAGELLADGRPRFRVVLVLVARQQGKTYLCQVLTLYWLFLEFQALVLGTSTNRDYAKRAWVKTIERAQAVDDLAAEIARDGVRMANGQECFTTTAGCEYVIAASNRRGGRSLTVNRLILDELREHKTWEAWSASTNAMNAVRDAQAIAVTNQGDDKGVVLDALRAPAVEHIETGAGDWRLGLFEWSAPDGSDVVDPVAMAAANPNYGRSRPHSTDPDALAGAAVRAKRAGGRELAQFKTEVLCMRVHQLDPAIDPDGWAAGGVDVADAVQLGAHRGRVALCFDLSLDGTHATLVAAAALGELVHVEVVAAWTSTDELPAETALRRALPAQVERVRPRRVSWFPKGPAAAVAAALAARKGKRPWPPRGVELDELTAELPAVCMGLAEVVKAGELRHARDPLLDAHVAAAQRLRSGDRWVFARRGSSPIDGTYALAGAVHTARILPPAPAPLVVL